ncbi:MAG: DegV family protein [Faecalibacterium sp.]|jgi:DegV family protein with EDD domain|nr:DegV family protein [Faecalibacterium sp.]
MFEIIADSACDIGLEKAKELQVKLIPFYVSPDGKDYHKEGEDQNVRDFYRLLVENPGLSPKTSLPSLDDYMKAFEPYAKEGRPVLCLCYTGKMSGSAGCARNAKEILLDEYPDAEIETMDTTAATVTQAMMVENACAMRDAGCTLKETVTWLTGCAPTNQIFFTVGNLDYLIRGGRIGKAKGMAANLLNIKPMIHFHDGEIFSGGVARGRLKSIEKAITQLMNYLADCHADPDDYRITVGYGYDEEEGRRLWMQVRAALRAHFPASKCEVGLLQIGTTICVHTGPYPLGIGVMRRWKPQKN